MSKKRVLTKRSGQGAEHPHEHRTLVAAIEQQTIDFSVPLPPPEILKQYQEMDPGAVEWLKERMNKEQEHRHALENKAAEIDKKYFTHVCLYEKTGLGAAFFVVLASLGVVAYGFYQGLQWGASILGGTTIVALAYAFLGNRKDNAGETVPEKSEDASQ